MAQKGHGQWIYFEHLFHEIKSCQRQHCDFCKKANSYARAPEVEPTLYSLRYPPMNGSVPVWWYLCQICIRCHGMAVKLHPRMQTWVGSLRMSNSVFWYDPKAIWIASYTREAINKPHGGNLGNSSRWKWDQELSWTPPMPNDMTPFHVVSSGCSLCRAGF